MPEKEGMRALRKHFEERHLKEEAPDTAVFWATVGIISVFVLVLAVVMVVRQGATTGQIVTQWAQPARPFASNPFACLDVPPCGSEISFMCCAENPLPGTGQKCTAPLAGYAATHTIGYPAAYESYGAGNPVCPEAMPHRCPCPEKFQYRQSWPVPSR